MIRITREQIVYRLDNENATVESIDSGETVLFETFDARTRTIISEHQLFDKPHPKWANPATGPIAIRGAEPGDSLCVHIEDIELADYGFLAVKRGEGLLAHMANEFATRIVNVNDGIVDFGRRLRFPTQPMVGVIGTTPVGTGVSTSFAGTHGGNMDNKYVTTGSRIYLPVSVPGAGLALGDVHGAMGDGEITFIGLEICAAVTVRVELCKGDSLRRHIIETDEYWITTGDHTDLASAVRMAAEEMVQLMQERMNLSFEEAYMLMSAVVDVQICQCCEPGEFPVTTRAVISKELMP